MDLVGHFLQPPNMRVNWPFFSNGTMYNLAEHYVLKF